MRVKELLKEKGITAKELAGLIGMTETGLSIAISDKGNPPLKRLEQIAGVLGVSVVELFEHRGDFTAFIRKDGELHQFDNIDKLKEWLNEIEQ